MTKKQSGPTAVVAQDSSFFEVVQLIDQARQYTARAINTALIELYWQVGQYVSQKTASAGWGKATVLELATYIQRTQPGIRGFSSQNIWRMRQFFEAYRSEPHLSTLLRELPWSSNLHILTRVKHPDERAFYLRKAVEQRWSVREVARQMDNHLFVRTQLVPAKVSTALREIHPLATQYLRDMYFFEFLGLTNDHSEADLHQGLIKHLGRFLTELGSDFCYVGSEYPIQVGGQDFALDLLFFHRILNCLLAIELKVTRFEPEHLGKLNFYLEALDQGHRKAHENPAIGVLLCASKDDEVVEYALNRSLSPALIAEYQTRLPDKKLLQAKLHEFYLQNVPVDDA